MQEIRIEGEIGPYPNDAQGLRERVEATRAETDEDLKFIISSEGGSVFVGYAMYNYMRTLKNIETHGEGLIGSIATLLLSAAPKDKTFISEVSMWMIHKALAPEMGNADDMRKKAKILDTIDSTLIDVYTSRTGLSREVIESLMSEELWINGADAVKAGFVGNLSNPIPAEAVAHAFIKSKNITPMKLENLLNRFRNEGEAPTEEPKKKEEEVKALTDEEVKKDEEKTPKAMTEEEEKKEEPTNALPEEIEEEEAEETEEEETEIEQLKADVQAIKESVEALAGAVSKVLDISEATAQANAEKTSDMEASIEAKVETRFKNMVASLPGSNALPITNEVINNGEGKTNPFAAHREEMAKINAEAKAKLKSIY